MLRGRSTGASGIVETTRHCGAPRVRSQGATALEPHATYPGRGASPLPLPWSAVSTTPRPCTARRRPGKGRASRSRYLRRLVNSADRKRTLGRSRGKRVALPIRRDAPIVEHADRQRHALDPRRPEKVERAPRVDFLGDAPCVRYALARGPSRNPTRVLATAPRMIVT